MSSFIFHEIQIHKKCNARNTTNIHIYEEWGILI
jgi:PAB1-binding protein PBP1